MYKVLRPEGMPGSEEIMIAPTYPTLIRHLAEMQRSMQGRSIHVDEHDGSLFDPPSRSWTYHCACDLDSPCDFHANREEE